MGTSRTKRESAHVCSSPRNQHKPLASVAVARILDAARDAVAMGSDEEISSVVARRTGYSEHTVDLVITKAYFATDAALRTQTMGIKNALTESQRTYWDVALEVA